MNRMLQEFFCSGCKGFIRVNLNLALRQIIVVCPKCDRKHTRYVTDGRITDQYVAKQHNIGAREVEEIMPTRAAWSDTPHTQRMREAEAKGIKKEVHNSIERNGVPLDVERWLEVAAREKGEIE